MTSRPNKSQRALTTNETCLVHLEQDLPGVLLPVHAQPGARSNGVNGAHDSRLKVAVTQPPEKGKANEALIKLLAKLLDLKRSQIELVEGLTSSRKKFHITGISVADLRNRINAILSSDPRR